LKKKKHHRSFSLPVVKRNRIVPERLFCTLFSVCEGAADRDDNDLECNAKRSINNYKKKEN
jgi:hypothetical protein